MLSYRTEGSDMNPTQSIHCSYLLFNFIMENAKKKKKFGQKLVKFSQQLIFTHQKNVVNDFERRNTKYLLTLNLNFPLLFLPFTFSVNLSALNILPSVRV